MTDRSQNLARLLITTGILLTGILHGGTASGLNWDYHPIADMGPGVLSFAIGDIEGDGTQKIYTSAPGCYQLISYQWESSSYQPDTLLYTNPQLDAGLFLTGDVDGDGREELYVVSKYGLKRLFQVSFDGADYDLVELGTISESTIAAFLVGDGDNDGRDEIYVGSWTELFQFDWTESGWEQQSIGLPSQCLWDVTLGDPENDGNNALYMTGDSYDYDSVYRIAWNGSAWQSEEAFTCWDLYADGHSTSGDARSASVAGEGTRRETDSAHRSRNAWIRLTDIVIGDLEGDGTEDLYVLLLDGDILGTYGYEYGKVSRAEWTHQGWTFEPALWSLSSEYWTAYSGSAPLPPRSGRLRREVPGTPNHSLHMVAFEGHDSLVGRHYDQYCVSGECETSSGIRRYYYAEGEYASETIHDFGETESNPHGVRMLRRGILNGQDESFFAITTLAGHNLWEYVSDSNYPWQSVEPLPTRDGPRLHAGPNPCTGRLTLTLDGRGMSNLSLAAATVTIHDATGRLVRILGIPAVQEVRQWSWDGRDASGIPCPNGLYLARLQGTGDSTPGGVRTAFLLVR